MANATTTLALRASTFDDEFSSFQSSPAGGIVGWATELPFWGATHTLSGNNEAEYYVDSSQPNGPFSVSNGILTIQASQASTTGANPLGLPYNSGVLSTYQSFSQLYGYFEIRAQLPGGAGLWPAFWLMPTSFKPGPELDVFEVLGDRPNILYASVHSAVPGAVIEQSLVVADTSAAFHTYGVDWGPQKTVFYMDGQVIATASTPGDMNVPMYMLLNLAVGGASSWPGAPTTQTQFPTNMSIDYVHVYQTANTIGWTDPAPAQPSPLVLPAVQATAGWGSAQVYVFVEYRANQNAGTPLGGIGVALLNAAGLIVATGVTGPNGFHTFSGLAAGNYSIKYIMPDAYSIFPGCLADPVSGVTSTFSLSAGQNFGVPYQLVTSSAELAGTVQLDGQGLGNTSVKILNLDNGVTSTTLTDATGRFTFWTAPGLYTVSYTPPAGAVLAVGGLADATSGLTAPVLLADGQDFLLIPAQFVSSTSLATSTGVAPQIAASTASNVAVYRFFDKTNGTQFLTASAAERDAIIKTRPDLVAEGTGIGAVAGSSGDPGTVPVYRFFDTHAGTHFFTSSSSERDGLIAHRPDLTFEGTGFYEHQTAKPGDSAVFRFFDSINGTHFYTSSESEHTAILASRPDMISEGVAFYAPTQG